MAFMKEMSKKQNANKVRRAGPLGKQGSFILKHFGKHAVENGRKAARRTANFTKHGHRGDTFEDKLKRNKDREDGVSFSGPRPDTKMGQTSGSASAKKKKSGGAGSPSKRGPGKPKGRV